MTANPLNDYFRKPEVSIRLPAGSWYEDGEVKFNTAGEIDVYSMLPADEIMLSNPDALVTGSAIAEIFKSCAPAVKNSDRLFYPDVNAILLAIQKATYGSKITQAAMCPKCGEKRQEIVFNKIVDICTERKWNIDELTPEQASEVRALGIEQTRDKLGEMERNKEIMLKPVKMEWGYDDLVGAMTFLPSEQIVKIKDLEVYCAPYRCGDRVNFANMNIAQNRIKKLYEEIRGKGVDGIDRDYIETVQRTLDNYKQVNVEVIKLISKCILKIVLPTGEIVSDRGFIEEFMLNTSVTELNAVRDAVDALTNMGVPHTLKFDCPCCGHKWEERFNGFNPTDFFGISS